LYKPNQEYFHVMAAFIRFCTKFIILTEENSDYTHIQQTVFEYLVQFSHYNRHVM